MAVSQPLPLDIGEMLQRAVALQQQGQLREAEKIYGRVLKAVPDQFDALNLLGTVKVQRGQAGEAYRLISAALKVNPRVPDAWVNLGVALHALKRDAEALESFDKALALRPGDAGAFDQRGNVLLATGRFQDALAAFDQALSLGLRHPQVRLNRGIALAALGRHPEALAEFDAVLASVANHPAAHYNCGVALFSLGRYTEAVAAYDRALSAAPDHAKALNNRGLALQALNRPSDALASYRKAIELQRDYADAHLNQALALLTIGDFPRGFQEYEWRWRRTGMPTQRLGHGRPLWLGEYPLQRKTILLQAEQGLGDTIQFVRYVPLLMRAGAKVVLEVQQELAPLLAKIGAGVVARGDAPPAFDVHCPVGSLPLALKTEPATIPADIPYLAADQSRVAKWRARLAELARRRGEGGSEQPEPRFKVAIAWSGNPRHVNDHNRSIAFAQLAPLWAAPATEFVSVQRDLRSDDAGALADQSHVTHIGSELDDFADTAAVLALVDLVITVDTSVAHLAGAMGRPVWILLPFSADWRWGQTSETSHWYPSARLLRQPALGDWKSVLERVRADLEHRGFAVQTEQG
jgi:tetratricopeptide (TPR) repeat protein